jgi:hypothetical protein
MLGLPRQRGGSTRGASQRTPWAGNSSTGCEQCGGTGRVSDDSAYYELDAGVRPRVWRPRARTTKRDETPAKDAIEGERRTIDATAPTLVERLTALEVQFAEQKQLVRETARQVGIDPDNEHLSDEAIRRFFEEQAD